MLDSHREACSEYNISIDSATYQAGRTEGLNQYCTPDNGYAIGSQGVYYHNVCSDSEFTKNYDIGKQVYRLSQKIEQKEKEIDDLEDQYGEAENDHEKHTLRNRIKKANREIISYEKKIVALKLISGKGIHEVIGIL